jgi:hypothetical protein
VATAALKPGDLVLGTSRNPIMTDFVQATVGPLQPDSRLSSSHHSFGTLLVVPLPNGDLTIGSDANNFILEMRDVFVVDQMGSRAIDSVATPARITFKMVWKSTGEPVV